MNKKGMKTKVVRFLENEPHRKFKAKTIARALGVKNSEYVQFRNFLKELAGQGELVKVGRNLYRLNKKPPLEIGRLKVKTQGYGFVQVLDSDEEIFISQRNMGHALNGDLVAVQRFAEPHKGLLAEGRIDHVVERKHRFITGTFRKGKYFNYVTPDDLKIPWDIIIHDEYTNGAQPGQKVAATIDYWEDRDLNPTGRIIEVLGDRDEPGVDIKAVMYDFNLSPEFPDEVEKAAQAISERIPDEELERRLDLREWDCFTIDPRDAKDFDDAVSLQLLENGNWLLGVHIADVSHYVAEGGVVDREALKRATSVYLVDRVVPMLPEHLSNVVCSLQPGKDRLTFSVLMTFTPSGKLLDYKITPSVIHSKRRFTYEEVEEIIQKGEGDFAETLQNMHKLSQVFYRERLRKGSLDFETPEVDIILDENGKPVDIHKKKRLSSHRLIEEFMLTANKVVAEHVALHLTNKYQLSRRLPFIYRVHERPSPEKIADFARLVQTLGYEFRGRKRVTSSHLLEILEQVKGSPEENIINQVMLRSLMKAKYDVKNEGHFGLAFAYYTHFTSPIRRYPDLEVHRLLKEYERLPAKERISKLRDSLPKICEISTEQEINAMEAERRSVKIKQTEFMLDKLGEEYEGIISGIVPFGIFVEIIEYLVEGLVHVNDLISDYYIHDELNFRLIGKMTGRVYRLGDRVRVKVVRVDPGERIVDFQLVEKPHSREEKQRMRKRKTARGKMVRKEGLSRSKRR